ncbi:hypothetical protein ACHAPJ_008833 [Fusarium lateritium]
MFHRKATLKDRLGFTRTSSFVFFCIFGGWLFLFSVLQLPYIDIDRVLCAPDPWSVPGECYWFGKPGLMRTGMVLHLATILPAGALVCFQFIPALRRAQYKKFHRVNGYIVLALSAFGTVGALIIEKRAMGGIPSNRVGTWILATGFVGMMVMAMISIKKGRVEQHRAWMLRGWFWVSNPLILVMIY